MLVEDVIKLAVDTVQEHHPATKKFIIQSDNASGFASQESIQLILNMNTRLDYEKNCVEQMDIHRNTDRENMIGCLLLIHQLKLQAYVADENYILVEDDTVKTISFNGVISGTADVLVDAENLFVNISLTKTNFHIRTVERETHGLCWQ